MRSALAAAIAAVVLGLAGMAHAEEDYNTTGKTFGKSQLNTLKSGVSNQNAQEAPFYTNDPPQKSAYGAASLFEVGSGRINTCRTASSTGNAVADQECQAVNFLAKNPENRVRFELSPSDPAVIASRGHANSAAGLLDQITGGQACQDRTTTTPAEHSTESCVEYFPVEEESCTIGQRVDVNADSNFSCDVTYRALERYTCSKRLTVTCERPAGCNLGGVLGNPNGDMEVKTSTAADGTYDIEFGLLGNNYWSGDRQTGEIYDRVLSVELADSSLVQRFQLVRVKFDDWFMVKVNDSVVYVGPFGGDRLEKVQRYTGTYEKADGVECRYESNESGSAYYCRKLTGTGSDSDGGTYPIYQELGVHTACTQTSTQWQCDFGSQLQTGPNTFVSPVEMRASRDFTVDIDLRPYLRTGTNRVFTRTVVGGEGEAYLRLNTQVQCPSDCRDVWEDQCADFRSRTQ